MNSTDTEFYTRRVRVSHALEEIEDTVAMYVGHNHEQKGEK